jgi:simple sugar transport system ATP-binding protein
VRAPHPIQTPLLAHREAGAAILRISEELEELLALSDRLAVIYGGQSLGIVPTEQAAINELGLMMTGSKIRSRE